MDEQTRFLQKVIYNPETHCWDWIGSKYRFGYGHFRRKINGSWKMYKAHRYSYEFYKGVIPTGMLVLHTCDNPSCVNPQHLYTGTARDNHNDMTVRNRRKWGRNQKHRLLSIDIAKQIRYHKKLYPEKKLKWFSDKFLASIPQISRILNNKIWKEEK